MTYANFPPKPPIHALPSLAANAAWEAVNNFKAPDEIPFASAIFAMAFSCQDLINVRRPNGLESPCTLYFAVAAESGERKTTVDNAFMQPFYKYDNDTSAEYETQLKEHLIEHQTWEIELNLLAKLLGQVSQDENSKNEAKKAYKQHLMSEPKKPSLYRTIYADTTKEALITSLQENWHSAAIVSNEGDQTLNGAALRNFAMYNIFWDGGTITVDRKGDVPIRLRDARLSISMLLQPAALQKFMDNRGEEAKGSGLLARFLVCKPASTQGTRFINNSRISWEVLPKFHDRALQLIKQSHALGRNPSKRITLEFTPEAGVFWVKEFNAFENAVNFGGPLAQSKEHAAKAADNMARLAAIFHFFQGEEGDISLQAIQSASMVIRWFEDEYVRIFVPPPKLPQEIQDANELESWLRGGVINGIFNGAWRYVRKNFIRQHCPNHLREKNRLNLALNYLIQNQRICMLSCGKTAFIDLLPWLQHDQSHWSAAVNAFMTNN